MMNRRLRERLTEAEILQMFVEVCEGVAHMHNSSPPLLHRDLKVENILQSSATSFKLCDFGSATTVTRPPASSQEMRALEVDLNRHTTLQYRAPEMIDLPSRRPIDEKSDVWALGVLLYKLCYYTTPFEEHGPLAILNVQYRFPAYPVYSQQMMYLISESSRLIVFTYFSDLLRLGSMLREHGPQRPTVFEVLYSVHSLRGTKSAYTYSLPTPTPLAPRNLDFKSNPLDGVVTYRQSTVQITPRVQSTKVPEFPVPPERRGRPKSTTGQVSLLPLPSIKPAADTHIDKIKLVDDTDFGADGNAAWSSAIAKQTSIAVQSDSNSDEPWSMQSSKDFNKAAKPSPLLPHAGFNDSFAQRLWASAASSNMNKPSVPTPSPTPDTYTPNLGPLHHGVPSSDILKPKPDLNIQVNKGRDAFEGLGLMIPVSKSVQTLGEARKLRTGLATTSVNVNRPIRPSPSPRLRPKAHTPRVSPIPPARSLEADTSGPSLRSVIERVSSSVQTKFPSLEELDATFSFSPNVSSLETTDRQESKAIPRTPEPSTLPPRPKIGSSGTGATNGLHLPRPSLADAGGTRSEQLTGFVGWESKGDLPKGLKEEDLLSLNTDSRDGQDPSRLLRFPFFDLSRTQSQKDQSSQSAVGSNDVRFGSLANYRASADRSSDLLTGDDELDLSRQIFDSKLGHDTLKIREAPSKRASVIERSDTFEATIPQQGHVPAPLAKVFPTASDQSTETKLESPTASRPMKEFPAIDRSVTAIHPSSGLADNRSPVAITKSHITVKETDAKDIASDLSSSEDEGPEEPAPLSSLTQKVGARSVTKHKSRQGSVHNLVDLWEGGASNTKGKQHEPPVPLKQTIKPKSAYMPQHRPPSPQRKSLLSMSSNPSRPITSSRVDLPSQPSPSTPSPLSPSNRGRPQSMFIFPSKSAESSAPLSATLQPPEDTAPRYVRRTSISDMVQRYEAMEASARVTGNATASSPIISTKPLPSHEYSHDPSAVATSPAKRKTSLNDLPRPGPSGSQRVSPASPNVPRSTSLEESDVDTILPHPRNTSTLVSESVKSPVTSRKTVMGGEGVIRQAQLESLTSTCSSTNERSSSPERPYQGVGKLIDQWQRKSAEAEASRNVIPSKRTSLVPPKQAGLVPAHGKGS